MVILGYSQLSSFHGPMLRRSFATHRNIRRARREQIWRNRRPIYRTPTRIQHISGRRNNATWVVSDRIHSHVEYGARFPHPKAERAIIGLRCYPSLVSLPTKTNWWGFLQLRMTTTPPCPIGPLRRHFNNIRFPPELTLAQSLAPNADTGCPGPWA